MTTQAEGPTGNILLAGLADAVPHLVWVAGSDGVVLEYSRRIAKDLAGRIGKLLREEKPVAWAFAAPGPVKNAV